jgi:multidrug transporter EmrE-like cation transporter
VRPLLVISMIVAAVGYFMGEYYAKLWALSHEEMHAFDSFVSYTVSTVAWLGIMYCLKDIFVPSVIWELVCIVGAAVIGLWLFKEKLSPSQWTGAALAVVSMVLLMRK